MTVPSRCLGALAPDLHNLLEKAHNGPSKCIIAMIDHGSAIKADKRLALIADTVLSDYINTNQDCKYFKSNYLPFMQLLELNMNAP